MALIAAFEEAENIVAAPVDETAIDNAVEVGAAVADVAETVDEVEAINEDVAEGVEDVDTLQAIGDVAQEAVESGEGISEQTAEVATIAIEGIRNKLGFRGTRRVVPATESFGHASTRLASTKLVVEGIMDTIKDVWKAIKAMAQRIWDKIKMIFNKITGSGKALRDHIETLKKRARDLSPSAEMKDSELDNKSLAKKLSVNKEANVTTYKTLCANAKKLKEVSKELADTTAIRAATIRNKLEKLTGPNVTDEEIKVMNDEAKGAHDRVNQKVVQLPAIAADKWKAPKSENSKITYTAFGPFVNGSCVQVKTEGDKAEAGMKLSFGFGSVGDDNLASKAKGLSQSEILDVLNSAGGLAGEIEDLQKIEKDGADTTKNIVTACEKMISNVSKMAENSDSNQRHAFNAAKDAVQECFSTLNVLGAQAPQLYIQTAQAGAEYASACLANFKK